MWLDKVTPKKFFCKYSLQCGAKVVGVIMIILMIICIVATAVQASYMGSYSPECDMYLSYNIPFAYNITAVIYCFAMLVVTFWYMCAIKKKKSSVVLAYSVIFALWLVLTCCLLIVLICNYRERFFVWVIVLVFGLLAIVLLCYCFLVVYGYWRQMKSLDIGSTME